LIVPTFYAPRPRAAPSLRNDSIMARRGRLKPQENGHFLGGPGAAPKPSKGARRAANAATHKSFIKSRNGIPIVRDQTPEIQKKTFDREGGNICLRMPISS
jgi:hypothetical protein